MKNDNHLTRKDMDKIFNRATDNTTKCECGHSVVVTNKYDRVICSWCGKWVYKNAKARFKYKLKEELRRKK